MSRKKKAKTSFSADPLVYDQAGHRARTKFGIGFSVLIRGLLRAFAEGRLDAVFEAAPYLFSDEKKRAPGAGRPPKERNDS